MSFLTLFADSLPWCARRQCARRLLALAGLGVLACGGDGGVPTEPVVPAGALGTWTYFEVMQNAALAVSCSDEGLLELIQSGSAVVGTVQQSGSCTAPGGSVDNSGTANLSGLVFTESTIRFEAAGCHYAGDLFGAPVDSAAGSVSCTFQAGGSTVTLTGTWFSVKGVDLDPPTVSGAVGWPQGDTLFVPADTLVVSVTAADDRRLTWVGYRLGPPANLRDSVEVMDASFAAPFKPLVSSGWVGTPQLTVFAWDALGRLSELVADTIRVLDLVRRPFGSVLLGTVVTDLVYDANRDALYLVEPERAEVAVLNLAALTLGSPLTMPTVPSGSRRMGIDLVPSGDSAVVALGPPFVEMGPGSIGFIAVSTGDTSSVQFDGDPGTTEWVGDVRVVANGKAFAYGSRTDAGYTSFAIWEYDIATGTQRRRTEIGVSGNVGGSVQLTRSGDGSRLLLLDSNTGCGYVYDAATDGFSACKSFGFPASAIPSGTLTGDYWLVGNLFVNGDLEIVNALPAQSERGAIAPDGSVAYFTTSYGYEKLRLPDGASLERVRIPLAVSDLTVLGDGERLIVWTGAGLSSDLKLTDRITMVDLR